MNMLRSVCAAAALILLGACASNADAPSGTELIEDGRDIAIAECAQCHAVGGYGESPHAGAPPFRTLFSRYRAEVLEEELIAGIQVAHPMPDFQFNPQGADALIAYLRSIQTTEE